MNDPLSFAWLHDAVTWLLTPALAALLLACAIALIEAGLAVGERLSGLARLQAAGDVARVQAVARHRLERADLPTGAPLDSAFTRMRSQRAQEALTIRAQGNKQAQLVRAEADANAARIYAESFGKDPDFYAFYRAMQAYRTTFNNNNATVVLSTGNEFLREFEGKGKAR